MSAGPGFGEGFRVVRTPVWVIDLSVSGFVVGVACFEDRGGVFFGPGTDGIQGAEEFLPQDGELVLNSRWDLGEDAPCEQPVPFQCSKGLGKDFGGDALHGGSDRGIPLRAVLEGLEDQGCPFVPDALQNHPRRTVQIQHVERRLCSALSNSIHEDSMTG